MPWLSHLPNEYALQNHIASTTQHSLIALYYYLKHSKFHEEIFKNWGGGRAVP